MRNGVGKQKTSAEKNRGFSSGYRVRVSEVSIYRALGR